MPLWFLLACNGNDGTTDTGPSIVYPTSTEVLFYEGHGGETGRSLGVGVFAQAFALIEDLGYTVVEEEDDLGDPSAYRAVFLVDSGVNGAVVFNYDAVQALLGALEAGTRLVIVTSYDNCDAPSLNRLLDDLEVPIQITASPVEPNDVVDLDAQGDIQLLRDVERIYLRDPCGIEVDGAEAFLYDGRDVFGAFYRVGYGGDVVVIGDYNFMDDTELLDDVDNATLVRNLVQVGP